MRRSSLICLLIAACQGSGGIGDHCGGNGDCASSLQCVDNTCVSRCQRAPECGDGYSCNADGLCVAATGQLGDVCTSETDCSAGLACELDSNTPDAQGHLHSSCVSVSPGAPAAAECAADLDCRDGTCALGHCVDLCATTRDCASGTSCTGIPRVEAGGAMFQGCLQSHGTLRWTIPIDEPTQTVLLPAPDTARELVVTFQVDATDQLVGAISLTSPHSTPLIVDPEHYYTNAVRHRPELGQSVMVIPSSPGDPEPGAYAMTVSSLRPVGLGPGTATPRVTAVVKLDTSVLLDLHFYFLDLDDHPCASAFGSTLNAAGAQVAPFFQNDFLGMLRSVFAHGGVFLGTVTYEDLRDHPDLDGLDVADAASLLALGTHDVGINVFLVRTLKPVGLQAFGPNPGPAGLTGTSQSGVIVGLDALCYHQPSPWADLGRITAHEIARYMGLYDNVDLDGNPDPIGDDTSNSNLMFYSDDNGTDLSLGQRDILSRSAVLR
jgi:hypothetical protein